MSAGPLRERLEAIFNRIWLGRGAAAASLLPLAACYGTTIGLRRWAYRLGLLSVKHSAVPVIVVGNRIAGGAGKTPVVQAVVAHLREAGWQPGIVSRGHGRSRSEVEVLTATSRPRDAGDEPVLLRRTTGAPVAVGRDRYRAAAALLADHPGIDCLVADDGLQHLGWARDVEIVVFDARGAGNGWLLPAGPLREPIDAPGAARRLLRLYSAGTQSTALPGFMASRSLGGLVELSAWRRNPASERLGFQVLGRGRVHACAGIAQPQRFFDMLRATGLQVEPHALPDHADFDSLPWPSTATDVIVTEKDAVKLEPERLAVQRPTTKVWVAPLDFEAEPRFWHALDEALATSRTTALTSKGSTWTPD